MSELEAWDAQVPERPCPLCNAPGTYHRQMRSAPRTRIGGEGSNRQIMDMRRSFDERFHKSGGADDCRHRHGDAFDDSLRGGAVKKIKEKLGNA